MRLQWVTATNGGWLDLETVDLSNIQTSGVYVIWFGQAGPNVVRVGQGDIANRLSRHRNDRTILAYRQHGALKVTWAAVHPGYVDYVERFLANVLNPLVGDAFPNVQPLAVNLPGQ